MSMFKVGDKVVRKERCGEDEYFISKLGGSPYYIVTSVSDGGRFIQVDGIITRSDRHPWYVNNFELYQEPEDEELPPIPASVTYMNSKRGPGNDQRLILEKDNGGREGLMYIGVIPKKGSTRAKVEIGINIDPDSALQLAHDIRRMAMSVKRGRK